LHKGGGNSNRKKILDFYYLFSNIFAIIRKIENDSSRNVPVVLIAYRNEVLSYILATDTLLKSEFILFFSDLVKLKKQIAQVTFLKCLPIGSSICTLANNTFKKSGQFVRAAGCFGKVLKHFLNYSLVKLPSSEIKFFQNNSKINFGIPIYKINLIFRDPNFKAGKLRNLGYKVTSRKCAQNPIDHPHGGNTSSKAIGLNKYGKLKKFKKVNIKGRKSKKFIFKSR